MSTRAPLIFLILANPAWARLDGPSDAVTVRFIRPDQQLERVIALFDGAPVPHPAAALAAWRRGTGRDDVLSKAAQAAIAALNPDMMRELRTLDGARMGLRYDGDGRAGWSLVVPRDDGSIAALATALALTDGRPEPPVGGALVDRLGPEDSPLMARDGRGVVVAGTREALAEGLRRLRPEVPEAGPNPPPTGFLVRIDSAALALSGDLTARRLAGGLLGLGVRDVEAVVGLEGDALAAVVTTRLDHPADDDEAPTIDPAWLEVVPESGASVAFALAFEPGARSWDRLFAAADRVEKADASRAGSAPVRARLNLIANAAGVRPEVELWPALRGLSGFVSADDEGRIDGGLVALHALDEVAATRVADRVLPRLMRSLGLPGEGRPVIRRRGASALVAWGALADPRAEEGSERPGGSAVSMLKAAWGDRPPKRLVAFWPGRSPLPRLRPGSDSPLAAALAGAPPVVWCGWREGRTERDLVRWGGLGATIRRLLEGLPLKVEESE